MVREYSEAHNARIKEKFGGRGQRFFLEENKFFFSKIDFFVCVNFHMVHEYFETDKARIKKKFGGWGQRFFLKKIIFFSKILKFKKNGNEKLTLNSGTKQKKNYILVTTYFRLCH